MTKKQLPDVVTSTITQGKLAYQNVLSKDNFNYFTAKIDCSKLQAPAWKKDTKLPDYVNKFLDKLPETESACLYFFEILGNPDVAQVLTTYRKFSLNKKKHGRACSALKKNPDISTKILYVGKVKSDIWGRMLVHLGYYENTGTSGLQLYCWAKKIKLKLNIHVFYFEQEMRQFVSPLELSLANSLHPLIGKH